MEFWLQLVGTVILASFILFLFLKVLRNSNKKNQNSLDSTRRGRTVLITGPNKSGKTTLYQKLVEAPKILKTAHSLKENVSTLGPWKIIDLPLDNQKLHSEPADFFHASDLAALILCIGALESELELIVIMTFAVGVVKNVPLCVYSLTDLDKEILLSKLLRAFNSIQQSRLANLINSDSSNLISFSDPINRLIFETADGEVSAEYESRLREYFEEKSTFINNNDKDVKEWLNELTL